MIDKDATISNARDFFENRLDDLLSRANCNHADLHSMRIDGMPKAHSAGNTAENKMIDLETAKEHLECVVLAISNSDPVTRDILNSCYLNGQYNYVVANNLSLGTRQLGRLKNEALYDFAKRYKAVGESFGFTDTNLIRYTNENT